MYQILTLSVGKVLKKLYTRELLTEKEIDIHL